MTRKRVSRKSARPKTSEAGGTKRVNISLTPSAHAYFMKAAVKEGISLSSLIARIALGRAMKAGFKNGEQLQYRALRASDRAEAK